MASSESSAPQKAARELSFCAPQNTVPCDSDCRYRHGGVDRVGAANRALAAGHAGPGVPSRWYSPAEHLTYVAPGVLVPGDDLARYLCAFGMPLDLAMPAAGFYPRGGGKLEAVSRRRHRSALPADDAVTVAQAARRVVMGSRTSPRAGIAGRMQKRAIARLAPRGYACEFELVRWPGPGQGAAIALIAEHEDAVPATFMGLGERGKPSDSRGRPSYRPAPRVLAESPMPRLTCIRPDQESCWPLIPARPEPKRIYRVACDGSPAHERRDNPRVSGSPDYRRASGR